MENKEEGVRRGRDKREEWEEKCNGERMRTGRVTRERKQESAKGWKEKRKRK